jgi:hypothetical protein
MNRIKIIILGKIQKEEIMSRFDLLELIQKDIDSMKWIFENKKNKLTKVQICNLAKGLVKNLEELIELNDKKKKPIKN